MAGTRYLKNAWAKKDADGDYYLNSLKRQRSASVLLLSAKEGADKDSIARRALQRGSQSMRAPTER